MTPQATRRSFLRGKFSTPAEINRPALRPFGAVEDSRFTDACTDCGDCITACPEAIILRGHDDKPAVDFNKGACTFCGDCIDACQTGALEEYQPWHWRADTTDTCLAKNGVQCRSCEDHCDVSAIRFRLMTQGRAEPQIDETSCTGCGGCVAPCPVGAIQMVQMLQTTEAQTC